MSFWFFFTCFIVFLESKWDIFPLKRSVFEAQKVPFWGRKGQMVSLGSKTPGQLKCLQNNKTTIAPITGSGLKLDNNGHKTGERTPKGQMVPFSGGHLSFYPEYGGDCVAGISSNKGAKGTSTAVCQRCDPDHATEKDLQSHPRCWACKHTTSSSWVAVTSAAWVLFTRNASLVRQEKGT